MTPAAASSAPRLAQRLERWATAHALLMLGALAGSAALHSGWLLALCGPLSLGVLIGLHRDALRESGGFGAANLVTAVRIALSALLCAAPLLGGQRASALALLVLALDGVDGWLARRNAHATAFGARFDMESDAFYIASASFAAFVLDRLGGFILIAGALRYAYVLALAALHRSDAEAPRTRLGRYVFLIVALSLVLSLWPIPYLRVPLAAAALGLLLGSFAHSFTWSLRTRVRS